MSMVLLLVKESKVQVSEMQQFCTNNSLSSTCIFCLIQPLAYSSNNTSLQNYDLARLLTSRIFSDSHNTLKLCLVVILTLELIIALELMVGFTVGSKCQSLGILYSKTLVLDKHNFVSCRHQLVPHMKKKHKIRSYVTKVCVV